MVRARWIAALSLFLLAAASLPAFGVSKEIIMLQTQVQTLQNQITSMQQNFEEEMGAMKNLVEQNTDNVNKMAATVDALQKSVQQQTTQTGTHVDQVSGQIQALHDSLDELKAEVAQLNKQITAMQSAQQNIAPGGNPGDNSGNNGAGNGPPQAQQQAPPADVLYNNALRDYNAAKYSLAQQEFGDYLKFYSNTDLAGNAQFYIAEIEYRQGDYQQAVKDYDTVLQQYPGGNKTASAELKKGFALLSLGQRASGVRALHDVINRYPRSIEASEARDRLRRLTSESSTRRR